MTSPEKLLVVYGATGNQGGSVVETFLSVPGWKIRGITRNVDSAASKALTAQGVEMVSANAEDIPSLEKAFHGAHAIFSATDFWAPYFDPANQAAAKAQGIIINEWAYHHEKKLMLNIMAAASRVPTLERNIVSSLSGSKTFSKGKYTWIYHFDSKYDATVEGRALYPELWAKTSIVLLGVYLDNHVNFPFMRPTRQADGVYEIAFNGDPDLKVVPYVAPREDTGPCVKALVESAPGKNLLAFREMASLGDFLEAWEQKTGEKSRFRVVSFEEFAADPVFGREGAENFEFMRDFGYDGGDPTVVHAKDVSLKFRGALDYESISSCLSVLRSLTVI